MRLRKILLVDDDADDQLLFLDAIRAIDQSLQCEVANNGIEAIDHLNDMPPVPEIIFLDLNMPKMNGYECLEKIKSSAYREIPVVIFTTTANPREAERTRLMGALRFMTKTADFRKLKSELSEILLAI